MSLAAQALFGAAFAYLAAGILYTDQTQKRIGNERLLRLAALALAGYALLAAAAWAAARGGFGLSFPYPRPPFFAAAGGAALGGAAAGVLLWRLGAWPAGDAKLFAVLSLFLPAADPGSPLLPWRLPLVFLINVFIPAALFVAARTLWWVWHDKVRQPVGFWREMGLKRMPAFLVESQAEVLARLRAGLKDFSPRAAASAAGDMAAMTVVGAAATSWLAPTLGLRLPGPLLGMGACLAWDAVRAPLGRVLSWSLCAGGLWWAASSAPPDVMALFWKHWRQWAFFVTFMGLGMAAVRFFLGEGSRLLTLFWVGALFFGLIGPQWILGALGMTSAAGLFRWAAWGALFGLVYVLVTSFLEEDIDRLPPEKIHSRLVPASSTLELVRSEPELHEEHFARVYPDGLTEEQAGALAELCRRRGVDAAFRRTIPFAKWIFLGAAVTWSLRRDVLTVLLGG